MMTENNERRVVPYRLDLQQVKSVCKQIREEYGVEVVAIEETDTGYKFYGKYGIELGRWSYDFNEQKYRPFSFNNWAVSAIKNKQNEELNNKKKATGRKKLQKNVKRGVAIAAGSIAVLIGLGVIKVSNQNNSNNRVMAETVNTGVELEDANDLVVLSWADYAMSEINSTCSSSPYEVIQGMSGDIRTCYYAPLMSSYYTYLDQVDSFLPEKYVENSKSKERENIKSKALSFNKRLDDPYFKDLVFEKTPYAQAVAVDNNGVAITQNGAHSGEVVDSEGNAVTYDDSSKWSLYIPVFTIPGNVYESGNLPDDSILYNGNLYVGIEHYNDFTKENDVKNK